ncbi:hypothetical protein D3C81_2213240 [compost metagenome]
MNELADFRGDGLDFIMSEIYHFKCAQFFDPGGDLLQLIRRNIQNLQMVHIENFFRQVFKMILIEVQIGDFTPGP